MDWEEAFASTRMGGGSRVPTGDLAQDNEQGMVQSFSCPLDTIPPCNAAGRPHKRRASPLDGRDGKRTKSLDIGCGSGPSVACDDHQIQRSGEDSELPSSSGHPTETAWGNVILDHYRGSWSKQHIRSLELDGVNHKIFLSHSGAQKDFVEQLCVDLERGGSIASFFDQRDHSLPKGKDFAPLIKRAAQHCHVGVMVLSEEYLCSKWPMIELAEFHAAQEAGNQRLNMLPVFYKLSVKDLDERAIEERWMRRWRQLANDDERIDVAKWSDAVRALRKANGLVFGQKGLSEVAYRKDIVKSIFKLSPPELLYGSSRSMVGYRRMCMTVCDRFVRGTSGGPSVLGLYGTSGAGKTTLSKALCDHFSGEYMGRVCHVELGGSSRMGRACPVDLNETRRLRLAQVERVKRMLERLCGLDKDVLDRITDFDEGLTLMRKHMKREPVFLAVDDVTNDCSFWNEAREYLMAGFHPGSRIVITSRSISNVGDLVPDIQCCVAMPRLSVTEAGELFLRSAAPSKSIFELTAEERRIVGLCIRQCLLLEAAQGRGSDDDEDEDEEFLMEGDVHNAGEWNFHPVALSALGDFFRRYLSNTSMLGWRNYLEENKDPLWDLWKLPNGIGRIIGLQFHSLPYSEQLLFLDIAAFFSYSVYPCLGSNSYDPLVWLRKLHEETRPAMERRLQDLERSGMIVLDMGYMKIGILRISAHDMYKRFAEWYVTNHGVKGLKNAWCMFNTPRSTGNLDHVSTDLVRLRMFDLTRASARLLASKMVQELHNLEVLLLDSCPYLTELNLEGLESLRHIGLGRLQNLVAVTLTRSSDPAKSGGIFDSLQYVVLEKLGSLVHGPDVRLCTSLHAYHVRECPSMTNLDEMECPHLKQLELWGLVVDQAKRLPNVRALHALQYFCFDTWFPVTLTAVEAWRGVGLRDLGKPYLRVVEELVLYLRSEWVADDHISGRNPFMLIRWWKHNPVSENLHWRDSSGSEYSWV